MSFFNGFWFKMEQHYMMFRISKNPTPETGNEAVCGSQMALAKLRRPVERKDSPYS